MGLGGYLTWTAVAREIVRAAGVPGMKVIPVEQYPGGLIRVIKSEIFDHNPFILQSLESSTYCFPVVLNNPQSNYCKKDTPDHAIHRYDSHMIEQFCEFYGIKNPSLKCEIYFSTEEEKKVSEILKDIPRPYVCIEPQSNDEYCVNKKYPTEKWQKIVDDLVEKGVTLVQVGRFNSDYNLKNVINLCGKTSFREAALVIKSSCLFLSTDGGLMHAANAVGTKSIIVYTGFVHPKLTGYPENENIWIGRDHGPCGMKTFCRKCSEESSRHNHAEITDLAISILGA
jgi:ADP-heptose:LPS heptosyltransferase